MADGRALYKYLKFTLDVQDHTITKFAADLGTSITHLKDVVVRYGDREELPDDPDEHRLMVAVLAQLQHARPLPVLSLVER